MTDRGYLVQLLMDEEVLSILKKRLSAEQRADLAMELVNPHRPLTTTEKAALAGTHKRTINRRIERAAPARK